MNKLINITFAIAFCLVFTACEKTIPFDVPESEPLLVVNGFIADGDELSIQVSSSVSYLEQSSTLPQVTDAQIILKHNGEQVGEFIQSEVIEGTYVLDQTITDIGDYEVEVSAPDFESVNAMTELPEIVGEVLVTLDDFIEESHDFTIEFSDDPNTEDYYHLLIVESFDGETGGSIREFSSNDAVLLSAGGGESFGGENFFYDQALFSDAVLDAGANEIKFTVDIWDQYGSSDLKVQFIKCSRDYYLYHKSISAYDGSDGFFTQPVQVYTNVNGGIGAFVGYSFVEIPLEN